MKKSYEIDMCHGPLLGKLFIFALPLMGSGILELMFNAADIIVVGRFTGAEALAAVGATSTLITSLVNIFMGVAVGVNVLAAQYYGAGDRKNVEETVHTSILLGFFCGFCILVVGILFAENFLKMMSTPDDILGQAVLYMRIISWVCRHSWYIISEQLCCVPQVIRKDLCIFCLRQER